MVNGKCCELYCRHNEHCFSHLFSGNDQGLSEGHQREFRKSINCDEPALVEGDDYLIVGKGGLPIRDPNDYSVITG